MGDEAVAELEQNARAMLPENDIHDGWTRLVCIPAFGAAIPHLTGLYGALTPDMPRYWMGAAYFIALSVAIWHGNRWLLFRQRRRLNWLDRPLWKIALLLFAVVCYSAPLSLGALFGWYALLLRAPADRGAIQAATLMIVLCVVFITHVYETVFLIKDRESDLVRVERLQRAQLAAELEGLKAQIDPHFLFNSLNTLGHLIDTAPARAREFNDSLAHMYRYLLRSRDRRLVQLREELEFVDTYFQLLSLRFGKAIQLSCEVPEAEAERRLLPPVSLQLLVENAVKHNAFTDEAPLVIRIRLREGQVEVENERRPKELSAQSSRVGLKNLGERYRLLVSREPVVRADEARFAVSLPTLELA